MKYTSLKYCGRCRSQVCLRDKGMGLLHFVGVFGTEASSGVPCSGGGDVRATVVERKTF